MTPDTDAELIMVESWLWRIEGVITRRISRDPDAVAREDAR